MGMIGLRGPDMIWNAMMAWGMVSTTEAMWGAQEDAMTEGLGVMLSVLTAEAMGVGALVGGTLQDPLGGMPQDTRDMLLAPLGDMPQAPLGIMAEEDILIMMPGGTMEVNMSVQCMMGAMVEEGSTSGGNEEGELAIMARKGLIMEGVGCTEVRPLIGWTILPPPRERGNLPAIQMPAPLTLHQYDLFT